MRGLTAPAALKRLRTQKQPAPVYLPGPGWQPSSVDDVALALHELDPELARLVLRSIYRGTEIGKHETSRDELRRLALLTVPLARLVHLERSTGVYG